MWSDLMFYKFAAIAGGAFIAAIALAVGLMYLMFLLAGSTALASLLVFLIAACGFIFIEAEGKYRTYKLRKGLRDD